MGAHPVEPEPQKEKRRRILRQAMLFTWGFFLAAVVVAVVGSALVAWLLSTTGLPFLETWIVLSVVVLLIPLIGIGVEAIRAKRKRPDE